jgi:mono/diheme cytochrome c family protein
MIAAMLYLSACAPADGNRTGSEYMMDMGHSIAYETNTLNYYKLNTWGSEEEYHAWAQPRLPQKGTIPRGYAGLANPADMDESLQFADDFKGMTVNGFVPYYYEDTEEDREKAKAEILMNPFPITSEGLARGKELYNVFCGICHGEKGDGNGYLVREDGGVYPAQPISLIDEALTTASNGRFYHSIMYGINVMGAYADKLSYEERWQVIHHIRSLQAKEQKLEYNEEVNTLNRFAIPGASLDKSSQQTGE